MGENLTRDRLLGNTEQVSECLLWTGYVDENGYGRLSVHGRRGTRAHRAMYESVYGPLPEGSVVHHTCANRSCVRPEHLQAVTPAENSAEMLERQSLHSRIDVLERLLAKCECDHG